MELEFDKEIDSLLRRADRGLVVAKNGGDRLGPHLDADELSAFAENLVPEGKRPLYMSHLADCDRCRGVLSSLIAMNAEAEPAEQSVVAPAVIPASTEPWYRRFLLPNLAYVMGGLILIFGGLITISLFRSSQMERSAAVSQAVESDSARGPMVAQPSESTYSMNSNATSAVANRLADTNKVAVQSANAANTSANAVGSALEKRAEPAPADDRNAVSTDSIDKRVAAAAPAPVAPPPPKAQTEELAMKPGVVRDEDRKVEEAKKDAEGERADLAASARQAKAKDVARTQAGGVTKSTPGPSRELQQNFPNRADNTFDMNEQKRVGGKGFQLKNNVWYDNSYRGQATLNVRRNTDEYRKLDSGLRKIAESIDGVVVVVWKEKAYRIQ